MRRGKFERVKPLVERLRPMTRSIIAIVLCMILPVSVLADVVADVSLGDVTIGDTQVTHTPTAGAEAVTQDHGGSVTVTGTTTENNVSVNVSAGNTVEVTLQDVTIDTSSTGGTSSTGEAAMDISGAGNVVVELDGNNSLEGGNFCAGLETSQDGGSLTIQDENNVAGSLTAQGGASGAGIGGGVDFNTATGGNGSNITITGGEVEATGGNGAAGIGGGSLGGNGSNITISGGEVTAIGGTTAAGIGGGNSGDGSNIEISDGEVTATGGYNGSGIGGGSLGDGSNIEISGGEVTATAGVNANNKGGGAGIGGGNLGEGSDISICGDAQVTATGAATSKGNAAAVGNGNHRDGVEQENNVDTSGLYTTGSFNGVAGTYVPPAPPAPPVVEEPAPAPEVIEEVKPVEPPVVNSTGESQTVKVQGEEVQVTLTESTVTVEIPEVVADAEKPTNVVLVITVAPEAIQTESDKVDPTATKTVVAALKELVKEIKVEHVQEEQETALAVNEYKVHLDQDGTITLELTEKLMQKLGKGIHEFVITIGGMEIVFSIEIK